MIKSTSQLWPRDPLQGVLWPYPWISRFFRQGFRTSSNCRIVGRAMWLARWRQILFHIILSRRLPKAWVSLSGPQFSVFLGSLMNIPTITKDLYPSDISFIRETLFNCITCAARNSASGPVFAGCSPFESAALNFFILPSSAQPAPFCRGPASTLTSAVSGALKLPWVQSGGEKLLARVFSRTFVFRD